MPRPASFQIFGDKEDASEYLFYPIGYYNDDKSYTKPADGTDLASSVTIAVGGFMALIAKAMQ